MPSPDPLSSPAALRPVRALLHPLWLGALALLLLNDHFFKGAGIVHDIVAGKLSDVAGMLVAPALFAVVVKARRRFTLGLCHAAVALGFSFLQLPAGAAFAERVMAPLSWRVWPDATDLLVLPLLALSWWVLVPAMERPLPLSSRLRESGQLGAGAVGLLACLGTSAVPPESPPVPPATPAVAVMAEDVAATAGFDASALDGRWRSESTATTEDSAAGEAVSFVQYRFDGGRYRASGYPAFDESGKVEVATPRGNRSNDRTMVIRLVDRLFDGQAEGPLELTATISEDGQVLTLNGERYRRVEAQVAVSADAESALADELVGP